MAFSVFLPLRIVQGILAAALLGLSAYVANWYDTDTLTASPTQINFLIFTPLFSALSMVYLIVVPIYMERISHPYAHLFFEVVNMLFYFAGFVALTTFLSQLLFCRGSVCAAARADAVFAALTWVTWTVSATICFRTIYKGLKTDRVATAAMKEAQSQARV